MTAEVKPLVEINQEAIRLLFHELGVVNSVRFLRQFTLGYGDSTGAQSSICEQNSSRNPRGDRETTRAEIRAHPTGTCRAR